MRTADLVAALERYGHPALAVAADVGAAAEVEHAVRQTVERFGRVDVLFNNAGISGVVAPVYELATDPSDDIVRINLRGIFLVQKHALRVMIAARVAGAVVNLSSSMAGCDVLAGGGGYAATKHAMLGLTRLAALDMAHTAFG